MMRRWIAFFITLAVAGLIVFGLFVLLGKIFEWVGWVW